MALLLTACSAAPAQPVDLDSVNERIDAVGNRIDLLTAEIDTLKGTIDVLTGAAIALERTVNQPIDLAKVNWGSFTGVVVRTSPPELDVTVDIGPCPDDQPRGFHQRYPGAVVSSSFHPLEPGVYCLRSLADEEWSEAGATIDIRDGV